MIRNSLYFSFFLFLGMNLIHAQSNLLESVKKNPKNAIEICSKFKELNSKGISANSDLAINYVSKKWKTKLSPLNAEILSIYIIGLNCPNVF